MDMENPDQFNAVFVSNVLRVPIDRDRSGLAVRPVRRFLRVGGSIKVRLFTEIDSRISFFNMTPTLIH
jgi:hypothetical protein